MPLLRLEDLTTRDSCSNPAGYLQAAALREWNIRGLAELTSFCTPEAESALSTVQRESNNFTSGTCF